MRAHIKKKSHKSNKVAVICSFDGVVLLINKQNPQELACHFKSIFPIQKSYSFQITKEGCSYACLCGVLHCCTGGLQHHVSYSNLFGISLTSYVINVCLTKRLCLKKKKQEICCVTISRQPTFVLSHP